MSSYSHEVMVELLRQRPTLLRGVLSAAGVHVVAPSPVDTTLTKVEPVELRADLVLLDEAAVLVVEVQLALDRRKSYSWPGYVSALWARHRRPVWLVVVTPSARVARWAGRGVDTGCMSLVPLVLGPESDIPSDSPEAAMLALFLAQHAATVASRAKAALIAANGIDDDRRDRYVHLVIQWLRAAHPALLEALVTSKEFVWPRDPWLEAHDRAVRSVAIAESVLALLDQTGVSVSDDDRSRILATTDEIVLRRWLLRAPSVGSAAELLADLSG